MTPLVLVSRWFEGQGRIQDGGEWIEGVDDLMCAVSH